MREAVTRMVGERNTKLARYMRRIRDAKHTERHRRHTQEDTD